MDGINDLGWDDECQHDHFEHCSTVEKLKAGVKGEESNEISKRVLIE